MLRGLILVVTAVCLLASCVSTPAYRVTLEGGREVISADWPDLNENTGYYRFRDREGKLQVVPENEVVKIVPLELD